MATARPGARRFDAADGHDSPAEEIARLKERAEELERQLAAFGQSRAASDYHAHLDEMAIAINGWFWETDNRLRFTYLSPNVENISGVSAEWHYGKSRYEMGIPGSVSREDWELHLGQLERREPFSDFIYQRKGPNGVKWLKVSGGPYYGRDGKFLGYRGSATDVTDEIETRRTADLLLAAIENHNEPIALWGADDRLILGNRKFREATGGESSGIGPGTRVEDFFRLGLTQGRYPDADGDPDIWLANRLDQFRNPAEPYEMRKPDGRWILKTDHRLEDGTTVMVSTDITSRKKAEAALAEKTRILETALATIPDGVQVVDKNLNLLAWNEQLFEVMGLSKNAVLNSRHPGRAFFEVIANRGDYGQGRLEDLVESRLVPMREQRPVSFERQLIDGKWIECRGGPMGDGGYVAVYRDIDENKRLTEKLKDLASVDELTRLSNRRHFMELASNEFDRSRRYVRPLSVAMLDIDHFKSVNDEYGHAAGDHVLRTVSAVCREIIRDSDRMGRIGGEEFALLMPETDAASATRLAERLRQAVADLVQRFNIEEFQVTASLGVEEMSTRHQSFDDLLADADKSLYEAKNNGRNRVECSGSDIWKTLKESSSSL